MNYNWLSAPFSDGTFKSVSLTHPRQTTATSTTKPDEHQVLETPISSTALYSCPQEGCIRVFQRSSALERHLSLEACELTPERYSMLDLNNTLFVLINVNIDTMNRRYQRLSLSRVSPFFKSKQFKSTQLNSTQIKSNQIKC